MVLRVARCAAAAAAVIVLVATVAREGDDATLGVGEAVALGLIEGATEFVPVSSTGHLVVAQRLMNLDGSQEATRAMSAYVVVIQGGALAAVAVLFRDRLVAIARGLLGRDPAGRRLAGHLLLAFAPSAVVGVSAGPWIQERLFAPLPVGIALVAGGVAIVVAGRASRPRRGCELHRASAAQAALIGAAQVAALWPGVSRSLVTILAAIAVGLSMPAAVEFSFLLGIVTLGTASAFELVVDGQEIGRTLGLSVLVVGAAAAAVSAAVAARTFIAYLQRRPLTVFAVYRVLVGTAIVVFAAAGVL